jgi:hypothetical protein
LAHCLDSDKLLFVSGGVFKLNLLVALGVRKPLRNAPAPAPAMLCARDLLVWRAPPGASD